MNGAGRNKRRDTLDAKGAKCKCETTKKFCVLEEEELNIPALENRHKEAIEEWNEFKVTEKKSQEEQILELYPVEIGEDT